MNFYLSATYPDLEDITVYVLESAAPSVGYLKRRRILGSDSDPEPIYFGQQFPFAEAFARASREGPVDNVAFVFVQLFRFEPNKIRGAAFYGTRDADGTLARPYLKTSSNLLEYELNFIHATLRPEENRLRLLKPQHFDFFRGQQPFQ